MIVVGVDENGLGPVLGPLVTTAVSLELSRYRPATHAEWGKSLGIDDSKTTAAFGQMKVAEGLTLALLELLHRSAPNDIDSLFASLLLDPPAELRRPCPTSTRPQCWSACVPLPCFGGELSAGRAMLKALQKKGVRIAHARSAVACTMFLNQRLKQGQSRVEVDLELMERLVLDARARASEDVRAICGMVGGIRNYVEKMRHFPRTAVSPVRATKGTLAYDVMNVGHVRFEIDADAQHLPVALSSMIGKYVRELWMLRQNRFYLERDASLEEVSGYHDPVTQRFIKSTVELRKKLAIHDDCFSRKSAKYAAVDENQLPLFD